MFPCGSSPRSAWLADSSPPATPRFSQPQAPRLHSSHYLGSNAAPLLLNWHRPNLSPFSEKATSKRAISNVS